MEFPPCPNCSRYDHARERNVTCAFCRYLRELVARVEALEAEVARFNPRPPEPGE